MKELRRMHAHIGHLVQEADYDDLREYLAECLDSLDRGPLLPERFHKPVLKTLKREGLWGHIEMICRDLELSYGDIIQEDEPIKRMLRSGRKAIAKAHPESPLVGPKTLGEDWFEQKSDPPVLHPEHGTPLDHLIFGYVSQGAEEGVFACTVMEHHEDNFLSVIVLDYTEEDFEGTIGGGEFKINSTVEVAIYEGDHIVYYFTENL